MPWHTESQPEEEQDADDVCYDEKYTQVERFDSWDDMESVVPEDALPLLVFIDGELYYRT